jgi:hypothetical protein
LITAVVAFVSAVLVDVLKTSIQDRRRRKALRQALYEELAAAIGICDVNYETSSRSGDDLEILQKVFSTMETQAYEMAKSDPVVFQRMKEHQTFSRL